MTSLHQIQFRYDPHEDRTLLRLTTTTRHEFRFWITRRYAKLLCAGLIDSAVRNTAVTPVARDAVLAFEKEAAIARADFNTRFDDSDTSMPLGDTPILLARLKCVRQGKGVILLAMHPLQGQGIEIRVDQTLLHSMLKLLAEAAQSAEWDLPDAIGQTPSTGPPSGPLN